MSYKPIAKNPKKSHGADRRKSGSKSAILNFRGVSVFWLSRMNGSAYQVARVLKLLVKLQATRPMCLFQHYLNMKSGIGAKKYNFKLLKIDVDFRDDFSLYLAKI